MLIIRVLIVNNCGIEKGRIKKKLFKNFVKKFLEFNDEFLKNEKKFLLSLILSVVLNKFLFFKIVI